MADRIENLPSSNEKPSNIDLNIMKEVFGEGMTVAQTLEIKKILIPAILFIVLSLPMMNKLLKNVIPDSEFFLMFVKTLIFIIVMVLLQFF